MADKSQIERRSMGNEEFMELVAGMGWSGPKPTIDPDAHPDLIDEDEED